MADQDLWPSLLSRVSAGGSLSVAEAEAQCSR
jgi:hypothetical protein